MTTSDTSLREKDRIQGMVRSINQYRNGDPKAICAGSAAQILYAVTDARHDVLVLWDFAVAAGKQVEATRLRIEALEAALTELTEYLDTYHFASERGRVARLVFSARAALSSEEGQS